MIRFIGVDPGDRWCGIASLQVDVLDNHARTWCGVIDVEQRGFFDTAHFIRSLLPATVVIENYRQRPQGFNSFGGGETLRLMGAIEYVVLDRGAGPVRWSPPGDPDKDLKELKLAGWLERWREYWPHARHKNWHHARSAWRVLGHFLMRDQPELLYKLRKARDIESYSPLLKAMPHELATAEFSWEIA